MVRVILENKKSYKIYKMYTPTFTLYTEANIYNALARKRAETRSKKSMKRLIGRKMKNRKQKTYFFNNYNNKAVTTNTLGVFVVEGEERKSINVLKKDQRLFYNNQKNNRCSVYFFKKTRRERELS